MSNAKAKKKGKQQKSLSHAEADWEKEAFGEGSEFANKLCFPSNPWNKEETIEINESIMGILDIESKIRKMSLSNLTLIQLL